MRGGLLYRWSIPVCFILLNALAFASLSPEHFQRLGSLWVGLFLIAFLFLREFFDELFKNDLPLQKVANELSLPAQVNAQLREAIREKFPEKSHDDERIDLAIKTVMAERVAKNLEALQPKIKTHLSWTEVTLLFAVTIQWGYGDLIHCFLTGMGWGKCY